MAGNDRNPANTIRPELLRPVAEPVDTYVAPARREQDESLMELARGLSKLDAGLGSMVAEKDKRDDEEDRLRAERDFHANNATGFAEAVQKGLVPSFASRAYVDGYKKTEGMVAGFDLERKFATAYDAFDKRNGDWGEFTRTFLRDNIKTDDPRVLAGLSPRVHSVIAGGYQRYITDKHQQTVSDSTNATVAAADNTVDAASAPGRVGQKVDYGRLWPDLARIRAESLARGEKAEDLDPKFADMVAAKAIELRDPKMLDWFSQRVPGQTYSWGDTEYGRKVKAETLHKLEVMGRQAISEQHRQDEAEKKKALGSVQTRTIDSIIANPSAPIPDSLLQEGTKYDPTFKTDALKWQRAILEGKGTSDPEALTNLNWEIMNGGGTQAIMRAMQAGTIRKPEELRAARTLLKDVEQAGGDIDKIMQGATARQIVSAINYRTQDKLNPSNPFAPEGMSNQGFSAAADFKRQLIQWRMAHPQATGLEQEKAVNDIGASVLNSVTQKPGGSSAYTRPADFPPDPFAKAPPVGQSVAPGGTSPPAAPARPPAASSPPPSSPAPTAPPAQPPPERAAIMKWWDGLPAADRQMASAAALEKGVPMPQLIETMYRAKVSPAPTAAPAAGGAAPTSPAAPPAPPVVTPAAPQVTTPAAPAIPAAPVAAPLPPGPAPASAIPAAPPAAAPAPSATPAASPAQPSAATTTTRIPLAPGLQPPPGVDPRGLPMQDEVGQAFKSAFARDTDPVPPDVMRQVSEAFTQAMRGQDDPDTGSYTLAALKDHPKAARILDFVAGPESGGNYNAYYAHAGSTKDLSKMSLSEIQQWMGTRGTPQSSATGRYQFMGYTLFGANGKPGLVQRLGLPMDTKFTPELQDRLALQLLKDRGLDRWASGKMDDATFASNLAQEWASLPLFQDRVVNRRAQKAGRSAYAGDGLNAAGVSIPQVQAALDEARALPGPDKVASLGGTASDASPTAPPQYPSPPGSPPEFFYGDSHAQEMNRLKGVNTKPYAKNGRNPIDVINAIVADTRKYPQGAVVGLSSGVANNPDLVNIVPMQIEAIKAKGLVPVLYGVGPKYPGMDAKLKAYAAAAGVPFQPLDGAFQPDGVHQRDYRPLIGKGGG